MNVPLIERARFFVRGFRCAVCGVRRDVRRVPMEDSRQPIWLCGQDEANVRRIGRLRRDLKENPRAGDWICNCAAVPGEDHERGCAYWRTQWQNH